MLGSSKVHLVIPCLKYIYFLNSFLLILIITNQWFTIFVKYFTYVIYLKYDIMKIIHYLSRILSNEKAERCILIIIY